MDSLGNPMPFHMTIAEALEQIGQQLQTHYGDDPIPGSELKRRTAQLGGHRESSVLPSDFCYNRINAGIPSDNHPMFVHEGRGLYRFVGRSCAYTGLRWHKPQGGPERVVGRWLEGTFVPGEIDV